MKWLFVGSVLFSSCFLWPSHWAGASWSLANGVFIQYPWMWTLLKIILVCSGTSSGQSCFVVGHRDPLTPTKLLTSSGKSKIKTVSSLSLDYYGNESCLRFIKHLERGWHLRDDL